MGSAAVCPGATFTTQITVTNFTSIGSMTLRIEYDSTVISFNPPPATFFNPSISGASINSTPVSGTTKKLMIAWASVTPVTLANGSMLATLSFTFINGTTTLFFNNDSDGGADCEYANASGIPLNDIPTSTYYINGQVSSAAAPQPSPISGPVSPCQGTNANYSVTPVSGVVYTWIVPSGWTIISGQGTSSMTVTVGNTGGIISVIPSNSCGNGLSRSLAVNPLLLPSTAGPITGSPAPCQGSVGNIYSINPVSNATGYTWTVPNTWTITSGQNTTSISAAAGTSGGSITVTASNTCGNSNTATFTVSPAQPPTANAGTNQTLGYGSSANLYGSATGGSGNYSWHWEPASMLINADVQNPVTLNLTYSVLFTLTVTDITSGCTGNSQVLVTITGGPLSVTVSANPNPVCIGNSTQLLALVSGGTGNYVFTWSSDPPGFNSALQDPLIIPVISTTYIVSVNDGFAIVEDSVHVIVLPLPGIPSRPSGPDTVDLQLVTNTIYTISPVPTAASYTWDLTPIDAGSITGTGLEGTVTWNQAFIGTAHIKVKTLNSCGESAWSPEKLTLVERTTGVPDIAGTGHLSVFPNPNQGVFNVRIESQSTEPYELQIVDLSGKTLLAFSNLRIKGSLEKEISLTYCSKGVYLIILKNPEDVIIRRLLIY